VALKSEALLNKFAAKVVLVEWPLALVETTPVNRTARLPLEKTPQQLP
jgi:hypothetical protein